MNNDKNPVVLCEGDYKKFSEILNLKQTSNASHEMSLAHEISRAIIVKDNAFPPNTIRINSKVVVKDIDTKKEIDFQLVMPAEADARDKKISILSPMAAAIIGFREGDEVDWQMPAGMKHLKILQVSN